MQLSPVDSLSLKIHSFLRNAGIIEDPSKSSATQLVGYFESEYGPRFDRLFRDPNGSMNNWSEMKNQKTSSMPEIFLSPPDEEPSIETFGFY